MIKDIFLPTKIQSYYLFSQNIVGFSVGKRTIHATLIRAHREKRFILKFVEENYDSQVEGSFVEALNKIKEKIGAYDEAHIALPSSIAFFKQLSLPFITYEKIKLVLPMEIEPLLPFSLQDAYIDVLINTIDETSKTSDVIAVAVKKSVMDSFINPFIQVGIHPKQVTIGILELYAFSQSLPEYSQDKLAALIELTPSETNIVLFAHKEIKTIRSIPRGIDQDLMRLDLGVGTELLSKETKQFFADIQFTIQATLKNENIQQPLESVILCGSGSQVAGITTFARDMFNCESKKLQPNNIIHQKHISLEQNVSIPDGYTTSLATALSLDFTKNFNLGSEYLKKEALQLFTRQLIACALLIFAIIVSFGTYSFLTTRKLKTELDQSSNQVLQRLTKEFNLPASKSKKGKSLTQVINETRQKLAYEENIWFALSTTSRFAFLHYLQELSTQINPQKLGLKIKRLTIKSDDRNGEDTLIIEGSVKDYDALRTFEENLQDTKLFKNVPKLQETKFNIPLVIDKNGRESL